MHHGLRIGALETHITGMVPGTRRCHRFQAQLTEPGNEPLGEGTHVGGHRIDAEAFDVGERFAQQVGAEVAGIAVLKAPRVGLHHKISRGRARGGRGPAGAARREVRLPPAVPDQDSVVDPEGELVAGADREIGEVGAQRHRAKGVAGVDQQHRSGSVKAICDRFKIHLLAGEGVHLADVDQARAAVAGIEQVVFVQHPAARRDKPEIDTQGLQAG